MSILESNYELSSSDYIRDTESILKYLTLSGHKIVKAKLHGTVVYVVTDIALAKRIYEDSRNFSFSPTELSSDQELTEGTKAFMDQGLDSQLLSAPHDDYKDSRKLFNLAVKHSYTDRIHAVDDLAKAHLTALLDDVCPPSVDMLALCRRYWLPLVADVIGVSRLSFSDLISMADCSRLLVEGNGLQGDRESIENLARANTRITSLIETIVDKNAAPPTSALAYFLSEVDTPTAIDFGRTFILGGIDTGSSGLVFQASLLASSPIQLSRYLELNESDQREAITELVSKEAPAYYSPRFALHDITIEGEKIPSGSFLQLALYGMNSCANPDFDVRRGVRNACPAHNNETLPFGHARHKCPGESLARHLSAVFLRGFFQRFNTVKIRNFSKDYKTFSRQIDNLIFDIG